MGKPDGLEISVGTTSAEDQRQGQASNDVVDRMMDPTSRPAAPPPTISSGPAGGCGYKNGPGARPVPTKG